MKVKSPERSKHNKILKLVKSYRITRSKRYKTDYQSVMDAGQYTYFVKRLKIRNKRSSSIIQINSNLDQQSTQIKTDKISYSKLINDLKINNINFAHQMLAKLTVDELFAFSQKV